MRFGRLPHDPVRLAAAHRHTFGTTLPPPVLDRSAYKWQPGLYGNDTLSDCVVANGIANSIRAKAVLTGADRYVAEEMVRICFAILAGNPPDLTSVQGLIVQDVMDFIGRKGFQTGRETLIGVAGTVDLTPLAMRQTMVEYATVGLGVQLYQEDMDAIKRGDPWTGGAPSTPLVGGHYVVGWSYDEVGIDKIVTWGMFQPATWEWVMSRTDEAHAVAWPQIEHVADAS
jgi:hypothetical protein